MHYTKTGRPVSFNDDTPDMVKNVLMSAYYTHTRIRIWYGETDPNAPDIGRSWLEEYDVLGYVGMSAGSQVVPLLVHNSRSHGGGAILTNRIVRIDSTTGEVLYLHPQFDPGLMFVAEETDPKLVEQGYTWQAKVSKRLAPGHRADFEVAARFTNKTSALNWCMFQMGYRYAK